MKAGKQGGFTLMELMITVVIVAILTSIAYPSYIQHVIRGHRGAAQAQMMDIANRQQQFFLANRQYADTLGAISYAVPPDVLARYDASIDAQNGLTPPRFTITFAPKGPQTGDGPLTLDSEGVKTPAEKWK